MLTPQDKSKLSQGLAFKGLKTIGLAALLAVLSPNTADAQVVSKKDVKKSHETMIEGQKNLFNDWVAYVEGEPVRENFTKKLARFKSDPTIFDSKSLKSAESKDPVEMRDAIVAEEVEDAMQLFKRDLELWVIGFNNHIANAEKVHAVKGGKADRGYGYGHSSHGYVADIDFFANNKKVFGKKGTKKLSEAYNKFLNAKFKEFKSGAEGLRNSDQAEYTKWLTQQTANTYQEVQDYTRELLEGIYDDINKQVFSTKNHVKKK